MGVFPSLTLLPLILSPVLSAPSAHQHVCPLPSARPRFCVCPGFTWQSRKHTGPLSSPTDTPAPSAPPAEAMEGSAPPRLSQRGTAHTSEKQHQWKAGRPGLQPGPGPPRGPGRLLSTPPHPIDISEGTSGSGSRGATTCQGQAAAVEGR